MGFVMFKISVKLSRFQQSNLFNEIRLTKSSSEATKYSLGGQCHETCHSQELSHQDTAGLCINIFYFCYFLSY